MFRTRVKSKNARVQFLLLLVLICFATNSIALSGISFLPAISYLYPEIMKSDYDEYMARERSCRTPNLAVARQAGRELAVLNQTVRATSHKDP
jgi:hypothetical protein